MASERRPTLGGNEKPNQPIKGHYDGPRDHNPVMALFDKSLVANLMGTLKTKKSAKIVTILTILIIVLFIIIIHLAVIIGSRNMPVTPKVCTTRECLLTAVLHKNYLDDTPPCNDFWLYSCNNWLHNMSQLHPHIAHNYNFVNDIKSRIRNFIRLDITYTSSRHTREFMRAMYDVCISSKLDWDNFKSDLIKDLKILSSDPLNQGSLIKLHTDYDVHPFFKFIVEEDDFSFRKNSIKIIPYGLTLPSPEHYFDPKYKHLVDKFKKFMERFMERMGMPDDSVREFVESVFTTEKSLASFVRNSDDALSNYTFEAPVAQSVKNLKKHYSILHSEQILQKCFKGRPIKDGTSVTLTQQSYFDKLSIFLKNQILQRNFTKYLAWRFYYRYAIYLSTSRSYYEDFMNTVEGFQSETDSDESDPCIETILNEVPYAAVSTWLTRNPIDARLEKASEIMNKIKESILENLDTITWIQDETTRDSIKRKIRNVEFVFLPNSSLLNLHDTESYYENYYTDHISIYSIYHSIKRLNLWKTHKLNGFLTGKDKLRPDLKLDDMFKIEYKYAGNIVQVGLLSLLNPFFDQSNVPVTNYGSFGYQIASAIMESVSPIGIKYDMNGEAQYSAFNLIGIKSLDAYDKAVSCVQDSLKSIENINHQLMLPKTFADILALRLLHKAYFRLERNHGLLPGLNLTDSQLLLLSISQSMCEYTSAKHRLNIQSIQKSLPGPERVRYVVARDPIFMKEFQCPAQESVCKDFNNH